MHQSTKPIQHNPREDNSNRIIQTEHLPTAKRFCASLGVGEKSFFLADEIQQRLEVFLEADADTDILAAKAVRRMFHGCQEIIVDSDYTYALLRPKIGVKSIVRLHPEMETLERVDRRQYLEVKDAYIQGYEVAAKSGLELDFQPFFQNFPKVNEPTEMGEGISFLNRHLSGQMYQNPIVFRRVLLKFLQSCKLDGADILVNDHLSSTELLLEELDYVRSILTEHSNDQSYSEVSHEMRVHGFEPGWGATVGDIADNLSLLARVMDSSDPARFESFLGRLPLVKTVLMVSPHGWFAQDGVMGKPDTGGQVTYILDQARSLERQLVRRFKESGIEAAPRIIILTRLIPDSENTTCNVAREKLHGTEDCWIVRVPFRDLNGEIIPHWISRFQLWPYLESFAEESKATVITELMGKPDLIIGHYSDGNLVAYRIADDLGVTHCAAVHALEKTKYILSDLYWADMEKDYRFSLQFTADLIAYNAADFIISSSYREIGGTDTEMGMFESYETFSMPGLYRVVSGMDPRLARHNIVPPSASEEFFFPYKKTEKRVDAVTRRLEERFLGPHSPEEAVGSLKNPNLPPILAMARIDKIKNLSGLVEIFGKKSSLRKSANLLIVSSLTDARQSEDQEEIDEINRMYELIDRYRLDGQVRWCAARLNKVETGEIYRIVADRKGVFAQPALMETFGLTVVEAMACGLPVAVTCFGGPSEIVVSGESGEVWNPNNHAAFAESIERIIQDRELWDKYSIGGVKRIREAFNWSTHAKKILRLANVYSYWDYLDTMNRPALDQYIHTIYHTVYRPRANAILEEI
ncbi:MAG: sucrose synthase [Pirellulales bacterium]|nr:sucrose synthase [Pirellulales bacterium]